MKKCFLIFLTFSFTLITVFAIYTVYTPSYEYNNTLVNYNSNQKYTTSRINQLEQDILTCDITLKQFLIKYKPQCIRKTFQGFYSVLMLNDDSLCFVFWDSKDNIYSVYRTKGFVSSNEFEQYIKIGETNVDSLTSLGYDYFYFPISKMMLTGHICTDGVIVVQYDENSTVKSINFFSNEELTTLDEFPKELIPSILPQDKTANQGTVPEQSGDGSLIDG